MRARVSAKVGRRVGEGQGDVLGVVLPQAWEVLGLHRGEVVGQLVDGGLVGVGHGGFPFW